MWLLRAFHVVVLKYVQKSSDLLLPRKDRAEFPRFSGLLLKNRMSLHQENDGFCLVLSLMPRSGRRQTPDADDTQHAHMRWN